MTCRPGAHHVNGAQALAFVRERHIGLGSDLQRIQRQQFFMAALLQQINSKNVLSSAPQLYTIAKDVAKTLTTDSGLSATTMLALAQSMKGMTSKAVQFTQVPVLPDPTDPNRVVWQQPQAGQLFSAVAHDQSVAKAKSSKKSPGPAAPSPAPVSPAKVLVKVLNATATPGLAGKTGTTLTQRHFTVTGTGNAVAPSATTIIQYTSASAGAQANALAQVVPNARVQQVTGITAGTVDLILGSDFTSLKAATGSSGSGSATSSSSALNNVTKTFGGITGNTNICNNRSAFSGPDVPSQFAP